VLSQEFQRLSESPQETTDCPRVQRFEAITSWTWHRLCCCISGKGKDNRCQLLSLSSAHSVAPPQVSPSDRVESPEVFAAAKIWFCCWRILGWLKPNSHPWLLVGLIHLFEVAICTIPPVSTRCANQSLFCRSYTTHPPSTAQSPLSQPVTTVLWMNYPPLRVKAEIVQGSFPSRPWRLPNMARPPWKNPPLWWLLACSHVQPQESKSHMWPNAQDVYPLGERRPSSRAMFGAVIYVPSSLIVSVLVSNPTASFYDHLNPLQCIGQHGKDILVVPPNLQIHPFERSPRCPTRKKAHSLRCPTVVLQPFCQQPGPSKAREGITKPFNSPSMSLLPFKPEPSFIWTVEPHVH